MPDPAILPAFVAAVFILAITPGQDFAMIVARGIGEGRRVALLTVVGFALAGFVQVPLLASGLAVLLRSSSWLFTAIKIAGALYLIYIGVQLALHAHGPALNLVRPSTPPLKALRDGFISSLLNPKAILFLLAFLPQFVDGSRGGVTSQLLILGILMKLIVFVVESSFALSSGSIGVWLCRNPLWLKRQQYVTAAVLAAIGSLIIGMTLMG